MEGPEKFWFYVYLEMQYNLIYHYDSHKKVQSQTFLTYLTDSHKFLTQYKAVFVLACHF